MDCWSVWRVMAMARKASSPGPILLHVMRNEAGEVPARQKERENQSALMRFGVLCCLLGAIQCDVPSIPPQISPTHVAFSR